MAQAGIQENPQTAPAIRLMFGGDVMLGRHVKEHILRDGPDYPLEPVAQLRSAPDLTVVNLECALTSSLDTWTGAPKAFYFGAPPQAIHSLLGAGIDMVSLANNHALDFGVDGLVETQRLLRRHGIQQAGTGRDIGEAAAPAIVERCGVRFGMAAFCDHQQDFSARPNSPGIAYLDLDDEFAAVAALRSALEPLQRVAVDWPILSLHWGPNMALRPSQKFRRLAHPAIEMGWKILFGHSAHIFQGIEIHRGCPIIYAVGNLVDDYRGDPEFRNDHQLLFEMELAGGGLRRTVLHPLVIEECQARPAADAHLDYIADWMNALCGEMGTRMRRDGAWLWIDGPSAFN